MNKRCLKLLDEARNNPDGLRFSELQKLCECAGLYHDRTNGSHFIYKSGFLPFPVSIQKLHDGKAKGYQVEKIIDIIDEYNLGIED
ncbi:MAG: type II toxin-antitoxin system HicA family toxin [Nitrospirae bacterium]|nr:type II toxin-antitoxin system HicA family toxin [Nitrospirota bacterium]